MALTSLNLPRWNLLLAGQGDFDRIQEVDRQNADKSAIESNHHSDLVFGTDDGKLLLLSRQAT